MAKIVQFARGNKNLYNILTAEEKQRKIYIIKPLKGKKKMTCVK